MSRYSYRANRNDLVPSTPDEEDSGVATPDNSMKQVNDGSMLHFYWVFGEYPFSRENIYAEIIVNFARFSV
ncbi:hypothetical protein OUZ56_019983 [Daphnia magna]|uniref:Uncharacterized protein n=1 Tax=Daphnia magna TaxID=35525 RepID=A0ABQ9ZD56_9CRUS|nr:hypothetical protein OUZ56_019978 [Daphnia magna]KAK4010855.1 hypothetical protein OUZ56_019983 [Daphnia magna]